MITDALLALVVFAAAFALDYATARYNRAINAPVVRANRAASWSVVMYAVGAVGFLAIIKVDLWLMIPEVLGLYAGTWYVARRPTEKIAVVCVQCSPCTCGGAA